jgi:hypothetical protein
MREINCLSLQANIICLLLALIGSAAIIKHPDWFGETSEVMTPGVNCSACSAGEPVIRGPSHLVDVEGSAH